MCSCVCVFVFVCAWSRLPRVPLFVYLTMRKAIRPRRGRADEGRAVGTARLSTKMAAEGLRRSSRREVRFFFLALSFWESRLRARCAAGERRVACVRVHRQCAREILSYRTASPPARAAAASLSCPSRTARGKKKAQEEKKDGTRVDRVRTGVAVVAADARDVARGVEGRERAQTNERALLHRMSRMPPASDVAA